MPHVVDGDNLLGTWPGRSRSLDEKRELARQVDRWNRRERRSSVLVFDGPQPPGVAFAAETVFSGAGRSADAVILERLRASSDPRGVTVVTSDRALADRCRSLGARIEAPRAYRLRLLGSHDGDKPTEETDVDGWLDVFGSVNEE